MIRISATQSCLIILFFLSLAIYWFTANPLPGGYADSDEIITAAHLFSVAHPPGYGLLVVLTGIVQRLMFWLSPAYAANVFAGFLGAITLTLIYVTVVNFAKYVHTKNSLNFFSLAAMAMGVLIVGLSSLFWLYSSVIEVMSLGNVFVALTLYLVSKWIVHPAKPLTYVILTAISFGLGVAHLQSLITLAPCLLYFFIAFAPKTSTKWFLSLLSKMILIVGVSAAFFIMGNLIIIPLNARQQPFAWDFKPTLAGWWGMVTRADYQGYFIDTNTQVDNAYVATINRDRLTAMPLYLVTLWNHFAGLPLLIPLIGFVYLFRQNRLAAIGVFLAYLFSGLLFGSYVTLTSSHQGLLNFRLLVGTSHRQYLVGITTLGILSGFGGLALFNGIKGLFADSTRRYVATFVCVIPVISMFMANYGMANQRRNSLGYNYIRQMLMSAAPNSVIICGSDFTCFGLYYQNLVEKIRQDVTILSKNTRSSHYFLKNNLAYVGFEYSESPFFYAQEISWNVAHRPTYITDVDTFYVKYIGLDGSPFYLVPKSYLFQVIDRFPTHIDQFEDDQLANSYLATPPDFRDFFRLGFADYFASNYQTRAQLYNKYRDLNSAWTAMDYALSFNSENAELLQIAENFNEWGMVFAYTVNEKNEKPKNYLLKAKSLVSQDKLEEAYEAARLATYQYPLSIEAHQLLKTIYLKGGYQSYADRTQAHIDSIKEFTQPQP